MRIAQINQTYYPMVSGASIVMQRLAEGMAVRGHSVLVIAASERGPAYQVEQDNLRLARVASWRNPMRVGQRFTPNPKKAVQKALAEFSPEIVHLHDPLQMGTAGLDYCRRTGLPCMLTVHQVPAFVAKYAPNLPGLRASIEGLLWFYSRRLSSRFTCVITPSQAVADLVIQRLHFMPQVISNGIDLQQFRPGPLEPAEETQWRQKLGIPPCVPVILHVGRLDTDKQVDLVIQASALVLKESPAHLLVVGNGTQKDRLVQLCHELGIYEKSHFPGYISVLGGLPEIYRLGALFVTASQIENQALVLLEAVASGLPVVAVRAMGNPEMVHDGETGYLVSSAEPGALAESMLQLLKHPQQSIKMGQAGRELARLHSLDHTLDAYEQLYRSLITERR